MAKFHIKKTFELKKTKLGEIFVMAGEIIDGTIRVGMFAHIPLNGSVNMTVRIHGIEFMRRDGGEDICLCTQHKPDLFEILRGLNLEDETIEVTTEGSD